MPNDTFQDWFCLKNRATFTIDPKVNPTDARLYFGRDTLLARIKKQMSRAFIDPQVPKMMFYGAYGSGKTQTLYHLGYELGAHPPVSCKAKPYVVHIDMEFQSKTMADHWHLQLMEALGMAVVQGWLQTLFKTAPNFDSEVDKLACDTNIATAFKELRGGGDLAFASWRWLAGQRLTAKELQEIKVTRNLADVGVGDMVAAVLAVGNLARAVGSCLIFFMDEMEEIQNVRQGDAADSWHQYTRKLADNSNSSVGFVLGFKADTLDDAPRVLYRPDVISRIGKQNLIELEMLGAPANVKAFVEDMLKFLIDHEKAEKLIKADNLPSKLQTYPFSASAFDLMCDYACQDPAKSTPRNIIRIIDDNTVNEIAPVVFG
jgi:hypothetical protein